MLEIIIIIITFSLLIILHELGHFLVAKKFGVKVEEFGLGLPPRLFGKKIGETIFSLNLIPFGGFVRMYGEEENIKDSRSFTGKPIWQRILIVIAGCVAFWIIAAILLSILFGVGVRMAVTDGDYDGRLTDPIVQISPKDPLVPDFLPVMPNSPAYIAGLKPGDIIKEFSVPLSLKATPRRVASQFSINKISELQELIEKHKGEEITLTIQRGEEIFDKVLIPRVEPPEGEGAIGVSLVRTAIKSYPWHEAIQKGVVRTGAMTVMIVQAFGQMIESGVTREPLPPELRDAELMGPIGIFVFMREMLEMGIGHFLKITVIITIHLAIINLLPIPALDGGKLVFLLIEGIRRKPISPKIEQTMSTISFFLLIGLMIFITIRFDIPRLF